MAVAFRSKSVADASATSVTPSEPSGAAQDDILLMFHSVTINTLGTDNPVTNGWTLLYRWRAPGSFITSLYWIRRGASAPSYQSLTSSGAQNQQSSVLCWSGCETNGWPFSQCQFNGDHGQTRANPDTPSLNTIVDNTIVVSLGSAINNPTGSSYGMPSGYSTGEDSSSSTATRKFVMFGYKSIGTAATEDPGAFSGTNGTSVVHEATVALMPAQSGYPNFRSMTHSSTSGVATITPNEPTGAAENDLLFYFHVHDDSQALTSGPTGGWALLNTWTGTNAATHTRLYALRRGSAAPGYTVTLNGTNAYQEACVLCFSAVKTTGNGYGATTFGAARQATAVDTGSVTTTGDKSLVLSLGFLWTGALSPSFWVGPSGYADASNSSYVIDGSANQNTNPDLGAFFKRVATSGSAENPGAWNTVASNDTAEATVELLAVPSVGEVRRQVVFFGSGM